MIPESYLDTPEKRAVWKDVGRRFYSERRWAIERYLKIRTKDQKLARLAFNSTQVKLFSLIERQEALGLPVRIIIVKPRKVGVSTFIQGFFFQRCSTKKLQKALTVAHDMDSTEEMFQMNDLFYNELPEVLRPDKRYSSRQEIVFENPDEATRAAHPGLRSQLGIGTAGKLDLGRSKDIHLLHCSEIAFWPDPEETELSLLNAVPDLPSTVVFKESTPKGVGTKFHNDYEDAKNGRTAFSAFFEAWQDVEEYTLPLSTTVERFEGSLDDDEIDLRKAYDLTLGQLNWRRWAIENKCGRDSMKFMQEYPDNDVDCFLVSGRPRFNPKLLRSLLLRVQDPVARGMIRRDGSLIRLDEHQYGFVRIWKPPSPSRRYVMGADVAEGIEGGDYSCGQVYDWDSVELVAEWHGHTEPNDFGEELAKLGKIYNNCLIGVEANKDGGTVNTRLRNDGYPHLFYRQEFENRTNRRTSKLGWLTTSATKPVMINSLGDAARDGAHIPSRETVQEMMTFVIHDDGSVGAQYGCHDDRVIASAIAQEMRKRQGIERQFPNAKGN